VAFGMAYGGGDFAGADALLRVQAYRLTRNERHLQAARGFAEAYAGVEAVPAAGHIRAQVYGVLITLYLDLDELAGDDRWLPAAERYARFGIEDLYCRGLFRGASNLAIYDSELFVSTFVYALVRLADRRQNPAASVPPLYFHR
jgi:hypothetical protein